MTRLELLAPAKNLEYGMAAIDYGADAVYIGAPKFGARAAVGNSMEDIAQLAAYAHDFGAKVYMALNTVLYEDELEEARRIAVQAWEAGVDALIVQDMALLEMNLPPIPLHASTQTFNITPGKARFLEGAGFSRIILERALALDEIKDISSSVDIGIETFIHGAICVCYSGQCYMSQVVAGRSGNRGECVQPCRWEYNLVDQNKRKIIENKHLLSVGDLNLSDYLEELIDAGVTSFKVEGRLKDITYLKNTVAYYRQALDKIISRRADLEKSSLGETSFDFIPDPKKSFTRGFTDYFLKNKKNKVSSFNTPKSVGQYIGRVTSVARKSFVLEPAERLSNGDGICFLGPSGEFMGTNVNTAEGRTVFPNKMDGIAAGTEIYRNYDHSFARSLERSKTKRTIGLDARVFLSPDKIALRVTSPDGLSEESAVTGTFAPANDPKKSRVNLTAQMSKTGDTIYRIEEVNIEGEDVFIPASVANALRREALHKLTFKSRSLHKRETRPVFTNPVNVSVPSLSYLANVTNSLARKFYMDRGAEKIEQGLELRNEYEGKAVMKTRYCIRREIGECLKEKGCELKNGLHIENNYNIFELAFDCARCEMSVIYKGKKK